MEKKKRLSNRERNIRRFARYLDRTFKNKIYAIIMTMLGVIAFKVDSSDATFLVFTLMIAIPLFFARKNWVY